MLLLIFHFVCPFPLVFNLAVLLFLLLAMQFFIV